MKKINYKLHLGVIGESDKGKNMILEFLSHLAISSSINNEFQIIHQSIPLKVKVFQVEKIKDFVELYNSIEYLDGIIQILDLYDPHSISQILQDNYLEFYNLYNFQGSKILAAVDMNLINGKIDEEKLRISRLSLVRKTQELNFIYCFEISNQQSDFTELFDKIFDDAILKFKLSNPELYEQALNYGNVLTKQYNHNNH
ncbi:MAG: hypothetical protein KGD66_07940 [Candidatus Lokiarchaeota archaeon]|nr:hypothetical protein [Candidatus Lokiarchaeota archaeon]